MQACNSCGKCCIKYSNGDLSASEQDIDMWQLFKPDIAAYVKKGLIWYSPQSGKQLSLCPFLREVKNPQHPNKPFYSCDIYYDRPEDCRFYPVTVKQMINDQCEMLQDGDVDNPHQAQKDLDNLLADSRPSYE
ncbi:YkgJ family cysteine cluster protein [uncultured Paraglaciecola sp.]|uniref:YkgJ family cysteine cluster protein n=1 Tax=uncultured Paraglaciecola sp. TaxID=1765024 RepID=UPI0026160850|nr:YkgJ family cysteine cluster protein [uncultured Paraglaciecola sp.]